MNKRLLLLLTTLAGVANGVWMTILHTRYDKLGSVCSVTQKISCEVLTYKQYSEWFGIPVPVFATFMFVVLFIMAFRGWRKIGVNRMAEDAYIYFLSSISMLAAISMAFISFVIIKKLCVFCAIFYVIIVAMWILARKISKSHGESPCAAVMRECKTFYKSQGVWLTAIAFICVMALSHFAFERTATLSETAITIKGDDMKTMGNPTAKVTMVMFSDFQCPACKYGASLLKQLEDEGYASKIKIIYKFFPLDPSCNKGAPYGQHLMACDAAKAAVCAAQQQKFWRYHDRLFEDQESLYEKKYYEIAEKENLDMNKFAACIHSKSAMEEVKKDAEEGAAIPITATPTFFFNGKKYDGKLDADSLKSMINSLL